MHGSLINGAALSSFNCTVYEILKYFSSCEEGANWHRSGLLQLQDIEVCFIGRQII